MLQNKTSLPLLLELEQPQPQPQPQRLWLFRTSEKSGIRIMSEQPKVNQRC
jgi:hypothetical protein